MSRKPPPFLTFSHWTITSDVYNKFHIELSQQYYPEDITHDDNQLSTKPIRQKRLEIMKMTVSEDITHDDDQLSTKPYEENDSRLWYQKISHTMMINYPQKRLKMMESWKKRVYSKTSCVIFYI